MPAHWSIEDGQTIPTDVFTGDYHSHLRALTFSTGLDAHEMQLTAHCEDGSAYMLTFNRNGVPMGPAVRTIAPSEPPPEQTKSASLTAHEGPPKAKK